MQQAISPCPTQLVFSESLVPPEPPKSPDDGSIPLTSQKGIPTPAENRRRQKRLRTFRANERLFASFHVNLQMSAMRKLQQQRERHDDLRHADQLGRTVATKRASSSQGVSRGRLRHQVQQDHLLKRLPPSPLNSARIEFFHHMDSLRCTQRPLVQRPPSRCELISSNYDVFENPTPSRGLLSWPSARLGATREMGAGHRTFVSRPWTAAAENNLGSNLTTCRLQVASNSDDAHHAHCPETKHNDRRSTIDNAANYIENIVDKFL